MFQTLKNLRWISLFLFFCALVLPTFLQAQNIKISGKVIDKLTEESIPFANVFLKGTTIGTVSDIDGNYVLETERQADSIGVSAVGYKSFFQYLSSQPTQLLHFRVNRDDILIDEVVVYAGENPADILMRKIIKHKDNNDLNQFDSYEMEVYNKLELDMYELTEEFTNRKLFKPFKFIFENVDSVSEERPYLPMFITETLSNYYFKNNPSAKKEVITASRVSGMENGNESITQFLGNMYQNIDIFQNRIPVMGKNFVSPISDKGLFFYKYALMDSAFIDNKWCYQLTFKPKRKQENTFVGDMWVVDSVFAVRRISMQINAKDVNLNFIKKLSVHQEFSNVQDSTWALVKDKLVIDFISGKKPPDIIGRKSTYYKDFIFNKPETRQVFEDKEDLVIEEGVFDKDEAFWNAARHDSLSANEKAIYAMVDTLKKVPIIKTYINLVTVLFSGYYEVGKIEIGPYFTLGSWNEVEGMRFRLGARTSKKFSERMQYGAYLAYGIRDKRFKWGGNALFMLSRKPWQTLAIDYKEDTDIESENPEEFGQDNIFSGLVRRNVPQKLIHLRDTKITYTRDWKQGISNSISVLNRKMDPHFDFYYKNPNEELATLPDSTINTTEFQFKTRIAYKERFVSGKFSRTSLGTKYPVVNLTYALAHRGILGSDYNYHKVELDFYDWFKIGGMGYTEYILTAGKVFGEVPFPLLEIFPGNETFFFNMYSFNRMNHYEFIADTYATLLMTHHFDGAILNKVPLLRKLKLRSLITAKMAMGSLSQANIDAHDNEDSFQNFGNFEELADWKPIAPGFKDPYIEVGVGIENIVRLFRVDAIWRLTHTDTPGKVGIRLGMNLRF